MNPAPAQTTNFRGNELKQSHGLMSQITFSQKTNNSKIVSKHLLGGIDAQEYSLLTHPNDGSNVAETPIQQSDVHLEKKMEMFKNNIIQQNREEMGQGRLGGVNANAEGQASKVVNRQNHFEPKQGNQQIKNVGNQVKNQSQSMQGEGRLRSTSSSTRFSKKMVNSNIVSSEMKPPREMQENVLIYKTTELPMDSQNESTTIRSHSQQKINPQKVMGKPEVNQYNFEYSYQDPIYQVYTDQHGVVQGPNQFVTPNFNSFQLQMGNQLVYKGQGPPHQNHSMMQMSHMSQQNLENNINSMNSFVDPNEMVYMEQQPFQPQANVVYNMPHFHNEEDEEENMGTRQGRSTNPGVYQPNWKKARFHNKMKTQGVNKFRPHSNNVRHMQNAEGNGLWGMKNNFQRRRNKKPVFGQNSGLSKNKKKNNFQKIS